MTSIVSWHAVDSASGFHSLKYVLKVDIRRDACRVPHCTHRYTIRGIACESLAALTVPGNKGYLVGFEDDNVTCTCCSLPRSQESYRLYTVFSKLNETKGINLARFTFFGFKTRFCQAFGDLRMAAPSHGRSVDGHGGVRINTTSNRHGTTVGACMLSHHTRTCCCCCHPTCTPAAFTKLPCNQPLPTSSTNQSLPVTRSHATLCRCISP